MRCEFQALHAAEKRQAYLPVVEQISGNLLNVVCRYFLYALHHFIYVEETAEALGLSAKTVMREWQIAKVWLLRELT